MMGILYGMAFLIVISLTVVYFSSVMNQELRP